MPSENQPALGSQATIAAISQLFSTQLLTVEQFIQAKLDRIAQINPTLNSLITVRADLAMARATLLDQELWRQSRGQLHGIPIAVKDNIDTAEILTTIGSAHFCDRVPKTDAAVVQALTAAGAILLGKTNVSEFAADISGHNATYGDMPNPRNFAHTAGGSSGGMASAIAAQLCLGGLGTDTGGSIRIPASWTGIVGLRPTQGLISMAGVFPRAPSFDTVGVMAGCVADVAALWAAISGRRSPASTIQQSSSADLQRLRLGIVHNFTFRDVDPAIAQAIHQVIVRCQQQGAQIVTVTSAFLTQEFSPQLYSTIALYEFDQIFGATVRATPQNFGAKVRQDVTQGEQITFVDYTQAQAIRQQHMAQFSEIFNLIDLLLTPTTPRVAPLLTAAVVGRDRRFVQPFSWLGLPAISLPCGWSADLPIGLQLVGDRHTESALLQAAATIEAI